MNILMIDWHWPYVPGLEWKEIELNSKKVWKDYRAIACAIPAEFDEKGYVKCLVTLDSGQTEIRRFTREIFILRFIKEGGGNDVT